MNNFRLKNKNILFKQKQKNILFNSPVNIIKEYNDGFASIEIACDTDEYNIEDKFKIHTNLLNEYKDSTLYNKY